jgi:NADH:ubiquinone oxidoreductase subunit
MSLFKQLFTWWNGQTFGTWLMTWRAGRLVGTDAEGNRYYRNGDGSRRWVIFNGISEASRVPPDWHGWLHQTWQDPPTAVPLLKKAWEKPHLPNATGTGAAYHPPGSLLAAVPAKRADYEAWTPEG